jgi:hypothetical protein
MKSIIYRCTLLILGSFVFGCQQEVSIKTILESPDAVVLEKLGKAYPQFPALWPGYNPGGMSQYLIFPDDSGTPVRGYLMAPGVEDFPQGTESLEVYQTYGLPLRRNHQLFSQTETLKDVGGGLLFPGHQVGPVFYFAFRHSVTPGPLEYLNFKIKNNNWVPLFSTHELFHAYQAAQGWNKAGQKFNVNGYPLTEEMIALHLYLWDLGRDAYGLTTMEERALFLKRYAALRYTLKQLDPSADQLVTAMGDYQELLEGSARYVEHFGAIASYAPELTADPTHGWDNILTSNPTKSEIRNAFSHRIGYHVGAIVTRFLFAANVDVAAKYPQGKTPYLLTRELLIFFDDDLEAEMNAIYSSPDFTLYATRAAELYAILQN